MRINLFDIDDKGKAKITPHVKTIWYLQYIVDKYGKDDALKLFKIFDMVYNLNPQENPFANLPEENKYETVLRSTYPELERSVDLEDEIIEQALDLVGELYETPKYRAFKVIKKTHEKILKQLEFTPISLTKDEANMGEITKALNAFEELNKKMAISYKDYEDEMEVIRLKGGRESTDRRINGKEKELD